MAPKKKPQKKKNSDHSGRQPKSALPSTSAPRLQISAETETRLRRLLLNSDNQFTQPAQPPSSSTLSKSQTAKKLTLLYEKLSCEGFSNDQIELALASLKENATVESALDWLCLNVPGDELPLKFSSGRSLHNGEGTVNVVSTAREDFTPITRNVSPEENDGENVLVRTKVRSANADENVLDNPQSFQTDWIRRYMEQEEEDESKTWEDNADDNGNVFNKGSEPRTYDVIAKEYYAARLEATKAKQRRDKKSQEQAGHIIRKLKLELSTLGLSDDLLAQDFAVVSEDKITSSIQYNPEEIPALNMGSDAAFVVESPTDGNDAEGSISMELCVKAGTSSVPAPGKVSLEDVSDVGIGEFFIEDTASSGDLPPEVLEFQKREKLRELHSGKNLEKLEGIWKKVIMRIMQLTLSGATMEAGLQYSRFLGDPQKIPKAVLHQLCQKSGWEAPKFNKLLTSNAGISYAVSILRKSSGRGKSRKAGGLITFQLPDQNEMVESAEDAQNRVAAFALHKMFPDLPIHLVITDPYASLVLEWKEVELSSKVEEDVEERRAGFVNRLLNADGSSAGVVANAATNSSDTLERCHADEIESSGDIGSGPVAGGVDNAKDAESLALRKEKENKMKKEKYKEILKARAALPIAGLKNDILQMLKENSVLVVCGETGSGKTTQVPQFILDDMIESGCGGHCNIICTQPRRIAAISVAERVADERCEPLPGSDGSLVGYQVRLDSARNKKTKLLFCTTGILLRKLAGDRNLNGITHIIVDEVHERSILSALGFKPISEDKEHPNMIVAQNGSLCHNLYKGDFLLIVLKDLIEKQSSHAAIKLKVILMSATVDSNLFSRYFGNCPVLTAEGRTHPVTAYFLEDIYESINYHLTSDSPAALRCQPSAIAKSGPVGNHRGKKNLVLSAWGDESVLSGDYINPHYVSSSYKSFSEQTQQNLKRLDEDAIDYDLLEDLVCHVDDTCNDGAILIFLPGASEIYKLHDRLVASYRFAGPSSDWILPLHSSIASAEQKKVFLRPPESIRKVIIATNIAETSITIDDVVYVVDCGRHKENRYNPHKKLSTMVEDWISQANARQRRGRAGRVKPGICFCLYTRHRFEKLMRPYQVPEMLRMPLVELCLQIKLLSLGHIKPFLSKALEPPRDETMTSAISLLYEVGALGGDEELTPLGHHLAKLPVDVLIGKMMLYGAIFGCLSPILSISAFLSYKSPFLYPKDERQNVERAKLALLTDKLDGSNDPASCDRHSDHLLMMVAYRKWAKILSERGVKAAEQFCNSYYLSSSVLYMIRDMRMQFGTLLADIGLVNLPKNHEIVGNKKDKLDRWLSDKSLPFNCYSHHSSIVKAIICAGLYPNVAATEQGITPGALTSLQSSSNTTKDHPCWYDGRREVHIHPSSINCNSKAFQYPFLVFLEKVETNKVFLRDTTVISPFSILMFGGSINIHHQSGLVVIDGWLKLKAPAQFAVLFKELRSTLHSLLKELIRKPEKTTIADNEVVQSLVHLLLDEDKPQN